MKNKYTLTTLALLGSAVASHAAVLSTSSFTDTSFENGGSTTMNTSIYNVFGANNAPAALTTTDTGKWLMTGNTGTSIRVGILEKSNNYVSGQTTVPAGVDGSQFLTMTRGGNQSRNMMQYVNDGASTVGEITISLDYWVHQLKTTSTRNTPINLSLEIIAFNDPTTVNFMPATNSGNYDVITGTGFASSGSVYAGYTKTTAAVGFSTLSATLDLGTGYDYIGVVLGNYSADDPKGDNSADAIVVSFDNLQASAVPEPSAFGLIAGMLGLTWVMLRRRG